MPYLFLPTERTLKVATIVSVRVARVVVPVEVRKTIVSAIVPVPTEASGANKVRVNQVSSAFQIPYEI